MNKPKVSIVIRTFNEAEHVNKLFASIYKQAYPETMLEVVVVDSGSTDSTLITCKKYPVKLIEINPQDFTFGYSLNKGIEAATGEIVILVSAHCYPVNENWVNSLIEPFKDANVGCVYGKQRGNESSKFSEHIIFEAWFPDYEKHQEYPFCNNANCAIKRELWVKYRYDESLTGLEDLDFAKKIYNSGYKIFYQPNAAVYHIHNETYSQVFRRYEREALALKKIYDIRFILFDFCSMFIINVLTDCAKAFSEKQMLKNMVSIIRFRFCQFYGTYKGHKYKNKITDSLKRKFYYPAKIAKVNGKSDYIYFIRFSRYLKNIVSRTSK